ncbi:MAG: hypothetical protein U0003_04610 [Vampirovibrionales bacterium]
MNRLDLLCPHPGHSAVGWRTPPFEIARPWLDPRYLLLDEPFTGIDPIAIQDIHGLIRQLKQRGLGILLTDHNPKATLSIVDRPILCMTDALFLKAQTTKWPSTPWSASTTWAMILDCKQKALR